MLLFAVLLAAGCRPGGEAEPASSGSAPAQAPEATAPTSEPAETTPSEDPPEPEGVALANTAADPTPGDKAIADAEPAAEPPPPEPDPIPEEPYKVLMLGDSLVATGFGAMLEKKLDAHPHVVCYRKGKSASGLARPDFFDWMAEAKRQIEFRKPDLVIVIMGGNDGQDMPRKGKSKRVPWKDEAWPVAYRGRMDKFLAEVSGPEREVLWLGLPNMGLRSLEKKLVLIRGVQKEAVEALGDQATYVDTVPYTTNEAGDTLATAHVRNRKKAQKIRAEDKIHFTMPGSEYFADQIYPDVLHALSLPDVEDAEPAK